MIRALELSLGTVRPSQSNGASPAALRRWPISYLVKCAQPWFEGWVTWNRSPGAVQVVFCTPSDTGVNIPGTVLPPSVVSDNPLGYWNGKQTGFEEGRPIARLGEWGCW